MLEDLLDNAQIDVHHTDIVILLLDLADVIKLGVEVIVVFSLLQNVQIIVIIMVNVIKLMVHVIVIMDLLEMIVNHVKILPINVHIIDNKLTFVLIQDINNMLLNVSYSVKLENVVLLDLLVKN